MVNEIAAKHEIRRSIEETLAARGRDLCGPSNTLLRTAFVSTERHHRDRRTVCQEHTRQSRIGKDLVYINIRSLRIGLIIFTAIIRVYCRLAFFHRQKHRTSTRTETRTVWILLRNDPVLKRTKHRSGVIYRVFQKSTPLKTFWNIYFG